MQPDSGGANQKGQTVQSGMCFHAAGFEKETESDGRVFEQRSDVAQQPDVCAVTIRQRPFREEIERGLVSS